MRKSDEPGNYDAMNYKTKRQAQTLGGLVVAFGGVVFAIWYSDQALLGFVVALVGAGIIDPSTVINFFKKQYLP